MTKDELIIKQKRIIDEIWDTFYGQNLELANWHLNGTLEPIDNFFENNDWDIDDNTTDILGDK